MKKSLSHLPKHKREELRTLTEVVTEKIDAEFVILFGSYARGDWVEDRYIGDDGIIYEYKSDYDILIVAKNPRRYEYNNSQEKIAAKAKALGVRTDLSLIFHSVAEFKRAVNKGKYFFVDIVKEGIMLYSSERVPLPEMKELSIKERKYYAEKDFNNWFESASDFFGQFEYAYNDGKYKIAAFELHQSTERFYTAVALTFTGYKPKLHDLEKQGIRVLAFSNEFKDIFPKETQREKDLFDLLKRAYVEARYSMSYEITKEELEYLAERVKLLQATTEKVCKEKIESFETCS
ncbi:MAG: HEPN domain-containing protein [Victivallaceae bacterium]|nr:HEPN domain-containing protein [Victivallaceae bacterium]